MTDGQWLFTIFAALYLIECARWVPGAVWMIAGAGRSWRVRRPLQHLEVAGRKLLLLPVLPPLRVHLLTLPWQFVPSTPGLEHLPQDGGAPFLIPWPELAPKAEGGLLHLSAGHHLRLPDEGTATAWAQRLQGWSGLGAEAREKDFLKHARQSLDAAAIAAQAAALCARTRTLRLLGGVIFLWCFGVITAVYRWLGDGYEVLIAAGLLLLLLWVQAVVFWRATRKLDAPVKHRFWKTLAIACLPQHAMRAADLLCHGQPITAHPLAAKGLLDDTAWLRLARHFWKTIRHSQAASAALQTRALESFFKSHSIALEQLDETPEKQPGSAAWCPRCMAQFVDAQSVCKDCGGVQLKPF